MLVLTALSMATAQAPQLARYVDCKPMLTAAAGREREASDPPRDQPVRRGDPRQRPQRRCITLASV